MKPDNSCAEKVVIFDTTLRDGQQCPGAGIAPEKNIEYAILASDAHIDVLEAGFPSASNTDFEIVKSIAEEFGGAIDKPILCGLSQLRSEQIDLTMLSLLPAKNRARVHIYLPVDPNLMSASLGDRANDKKGLISLLHAEIKKITSEGFEVEFSPEGYSKVGSNFSFCGDLISSAVDAGASIINCPDTIGGASTFEGDRYFVNNMLRHKERIDSEFPSRVITWSTHCHNDLGLALVNTFEAVNKAGARQIEGCINGIGERAGNVSLEQCVMLLECFGSSMDPPLFTEVNTSKLRELSDFVSKYMLPRQPHWPICGDNAAKHSSGGHTNAIISNPLAYQPFDPKLVGKSIRFVFGPLSGSNHAQKIIEEFGYRCSENEKSIITSFLKELYADRRKGITDEELLEGYKQFRSPIVVRDIDYSRVRGKATITIVGKFFETEGTFSEVIEGADSALTALKAMIDSCYPGLSLEHYSCHSANPSIHAIGITKIILKDKLGRDFEGIAEDRDTQISAMKALIDATNNAYIETHYRTDFLKENIFLRECP